MASFEHEPSSAVVAALADRVLQTLPEHAQHLNNATSNNLTNFNYKLEFPTPIGFEVGYDHLVMKSWMIENRTLAFVLGALYLAALFTGRKLMASRAPFSLRGALAAWNVFMALFSIAVTVRVGPYFLRRLLTVPLHDQVCHAEYELHPVLSIWMDLFVVTKPMEFIDTLFIVLRKQHLHFLHYYHHITVVILCWYSLGIKTIPPNAIFYVAMNGFVHSVMYSYYCCRSARIRVPRIMQMSITGMQITQMIVGTFINLAVFAYRVSGRSCEAQNESIFLALSIYGSYFYLFSHFFYKTYLAPSKKPSAAPAAEPKQAIKVD